MTDHSTPTPEASSPTSGVGARPGYVGALSGIFDAASDTELAEALQALTVERRHNIFDTLGVLAHHEQAQRVDKRLCTTCGFGYVRCRRVNSKAPQWLQHEFEADRSRRDA